MWRADELELSSKIAHIKLIILGTHVRFPLRNIYALVLHMCFFRSVA